MLIIQNHTPTLPTSFYVVTYPVLALVNQTRITPRELFKSSVIASSQICLFQLFSFALAAVSQTTVLLRHCFSIYCYSKKCKVKGYLDFFLKVTQKRQRSVWKETSSQITKGIPTLGNLHDKHGVEFSLSSFQFPLPPSMLLGFPFTFSHASSFVLPGFPSIPSSLW